MEDDNDADVQERREEQRKGEGVGIMSAVMNASMLGREDDY